MSDYLWDKSGPPDPEIERLEKLLCTLGMQRKSRTILHKRVWIPVAIAACLLLAWIITHRTVPTWQIRTLAGNPAAESGRTIHTDGKSRARLELSDVGQVELEPDTSLRVLSAQSLDLTRGTIHAEIWAPPGQFFVNTPSARTVDLGCAYTLKVDDHGIGLVQVTVGWVAFESHGRESFIPAAAACETRPGRGPGVPYYQDASPALLEAVHQFDAGAQSVPAILREARQRDAITLWHLLRRVPPAERGEVFDRMAALIQIPSTVTREGVVAGDAAMLDNLWNSLDLGDTSWWRMWKSRTP
jgi:ferric-dicitrate binding protein FerR (iron transport regulator)